MMTRDAAQLEILRAYSAGAIGTRVAIERAGLRDYADLVMGLARHDLEFPRPSKTKAHQANLERARAILQPLLQHGN